MKNKEEQHQENNQNKVKDTNSYDPNITDQDKEILNNQSQDKQKGEYFKDRKQPIDYAGEDLDIPKEDDRKVFPTRSKAQDVEKERRPKESANSNDNIESQTETVYKGEKAEKYKDPSEKTREDREKK